MGEPHQMATWSATFVSWGQNTINPTAWLRAQIQQRSATISRFHTESDSPWLSRQRSDRMLKKTLTPINWELWPWKLCSVETSASFQTELNGTFFEPPVAKASLLVHERPLYTVIYTYYILYIIYYILYITLTAQSKCQGMQSFSDPPFRDYQGTHILPSCRNPRGYQGATFQHHPWQDATQVKQGPSRSTRHMFSRIHTSVESHSAEWSTVPTMGIWCSHTL